jgi:hypothetical protein
MKISRSFLALAMLGLSICCAANARAVTTSLGQNWNYVPDAWARGNNANTSYFGWDVMEASPTVLNFTRILDDSTPDLGVVGTPAQRLYQGTNGLANPAPTANGHRSGSSNYYSLFDNSNDTITGVAPSSGSGGFTTVVLQIIGGDASDLSDLSFTLPGFTKQKDLRGAEAGGQNVFWQEWTAPGANLPFAINMLSTQPHRSIDAFQVDTFWSQTEAINAISSIGVVPEPATCLLAAMGLIPIVARARRK